MAKTSKLTAKPAKIRLVFWTATVLIVSTMIFGMLFGCTPVNASTKTALTTVQQTTEQPLATTNPLTGLSGFNKNAVGKRPIAIAINNAPPARPQWGLCSPDIVVEGMVEGGITRMLWLFADVNAIPKVGSLRSARHDFVEIAEGFNSIFIHWGGSIYAYSAMKARNVDEIDGKIYAGTYFYRDKSRRVAIEHTGYTNGVSIAKALKNLNFNTQIDDYYASPFSFSSEDKAITPIGICRSISFEFSQSYKHEFKFNSQDKLYYNYLNSKPMVQDGGKQMAATNVILLYCSISLIPGGSGCVDMDLTGGTGVFATNGGYEKITWEKGRPDDMLKLFSTDGTELTLNVGKSYIGFVPTAQSSNTDIDTGETTTS